MENQDKYIGNKTEILEREEYKGRRRGINITYSLPDSDYTGAGFLGILYRVHRNEPTRMKFRRDRR